MILEIEYLNDDKSIISGVKETHLVFDAEEEIAHYLKYITKEKNATLDLNKISRVKLESEEIYVDKKIKKEEEMENYLRLCYGL